MGIDHVLPDVQVLLPDGTAAGSVVCVIGELVEGLGEVRGAWSLPLCRV